MSELRDPDGGWKPVLQCVRIAALRNLSMRPCESRRLQFLCELRDAIGRGAEAVAGNGGSRAAAAR